MSYPREVVVGCIVNENASASSTAIALNQTPAAVVAKWSFHAPVVIQRISLRLTTTLFNLTGAVVTANVVSGLMNATPTTSAICTMTLPLASTAAGTTAGTVFYNNSFTPVLVPVGSLLQISIAPGTVGGTAAGAGFFGFYGTFSPEEFTNETVNTCTLVKT